MSTLSIEELLEQANAIYEGNEDRGRCFAMYQQIVEEDPSNAYAINRLANCYNNGIGVEENEAQALVFYRRAAELGFRAGQYNLADSLRKANDPECIEWYEKALEGGDADAAFFLARIYLDGEIVAQNEALGIEYYERAVSMGDRDSMLSLAVCLLKGRGVAVDKERAASLMLRSAELGNAKAASNMVT